MDFSSTIKAQLEGHTVRVDVLVEFLFATATIRLWNGFGQLTTASPPKNWEGLGGLGSIDGLSQSINGVAPPQSFTVSGVDARFVDRAQGDRAEYYLRSVVTYLQFFDENWATLDSPLPLTMRQMTNMRIKRSQAQDGFTYTVTIEAETPFVTRGRPPFSYLTDRDQQLRFPGDKGLERVAGIDGKTVTFPDY